MKIGLLDSVIQSYHKNLDLASSFLQLEQIILEN